MLHYKQECCDLCGEVTDAQNERPYKDEKSGGLLCLGVCLNFFGPRGHLFGGPVCAARGAGKGVRQGTSAIAVEWGCGRLEWSCLDWNRPSIDFYLSLGAVPMCDWTVYRVSGEGMRKLAGE